MVVKPRRFCFYDADDDDLPTSSLRFLLTELRIHLDECRNNKRNQAEEHDDNKEGAITQHILHPS